MRVVAQRVTAGSVSWNGGAATIGHGFVLLVGAGGDDEDLAVQRLADKIIDLRVFADEAGRMNLSLVDVKGSALIVSPVHALRRHEPWPPPEPPQGRRSGPRGAAVRAFRGAFSGAWN